MKTSAHSEKADHLLKMLAEQYPAGGEVPGELAIPVELISELRQAGLLEQGAGGRPVLTEAGWKRGRELLRIHRLYEAHLASSSGLPPEQWHDLADKAEHKISPETADALADAMKRPRFDPHGDPIPTRDGQMVGRPGELLAATTPAGVYRIVHVEDEPPERFARLSREGVAAGLTVRVEPTLGTGILLLWAGRKVLVEWKDCPAISVEAEGAEAAVPERSLTDLSEGEEGRVAGMSPQCRGLQRRRLLDLGFVPGSKIRRLSQGAFGGPVNYWVRGTCIALRDEHAGWVFLESSAGRNS